ncbi:hypothetical protein SAMN04487844_13628 [Methylobacterium sp. yr596]|nr:hypothetical protein SAMN04487844_13628 [Methylobacterium sp. yr596]
MMAKHANAAEIKALPSPRPPRIPGGGAGCAFPTGDPERASSRDPPVPRRGRSVGIGDTPPRAW